MGYDVNTLHDLTDFYTQKNILLSCPKGMVGEPHKAMGKYTLFTNTERMEIL